VSVLTATAFEKLLVCLDPVRETAAGKYELLRLKLAKTFVWKGCPESEADALADTVLDRAALKIASGEQIKNINAYAAEVSRFVWLEHLRRRREDAVGDDLPEVAMQADIEILNDPDLRMQCLRKCLAEVVPDEADRMLIVGYYDTEAGGKNKDSRKQLADKLNISMTTLKVKACRLRSRLETCINECVARLVTETPVSDTYIREKEVGRNDAN
jgi:DNA-directed RNA polymerase specialized sigma24 family protein